MGERDGVVAGNEHPLLYETDFGGSQGRLPHRDSLAPYLWREAVFRIQIGAIMSETYVMGRPDFRNHSFGKTEIEKHPKYIYSSSMNGMLIHKVSYVEAHWYEVADGGEKLLRLESPKLIGVSVCGQHFFIHLPRAKRNQKFRAAMCEIPKPDAVMCGRCHGEVATFGKRGNPPCSKEMARIRKGCLQRAVRG